MYLHYLLKELGYFIKKTRRLFLSKLDQKIDRRSNFQNCVFKISFNQITLDFKDCFKMFSHLKDFIVPSVRKN